MIKFKTDRQLNILTTHTNKALKEILKDATVKQLETISKATNLKEIIESLLHKSSQNSKSDKILLELIKNNPTFKELGKVTTTLKALLETIQLDKNPLPTEKLLSQFLIDIKDIDETNFKSKLLNSGIFLESKIKNIQSPHDAKELLANDFKALLLKAHDEISQSNNTHKEHLLKHIDKLSLQIDYYQLSSHLSNSSSIYLPYSWDNLEDANINIKNFKDDKCYCDIELKLKKYGDINLRLLIYDKNQLNINIDTQNSDLKSLIKENIPMLRKKLIKSHISPREIRFLTKNKRDKKSVYEHESIDLDIGFEVKA